MWVREAPVAIFTCNIKGYITFSNKAAAALWGREPEWGKDLWYTLAKMYYPDGTPFPTGAYFTGEAAVKNMPDQGEDMILERADHEFRNVKLFTTPLFGPDHNLAGTQHMLIDISGSKHIISRQAVLSAIVESSDDAIISIDLDGNIISWNKGAEKIFGYREQEVVGRSIKILIPADKLTEEDHILSSIRSGIKVDHFETVRTGKTGRPVPVSLTVSPVKDKAGRIIGASKVARDISEQLYQQQIIREHSDLLEILNAIGKGIAEKLDARAILQRVAEGMIRITGAAYGSFLYKKGNEQGALFSPLMFAIAAQAIAAAPDSLPATLSPSLFGSGRIVRMDDLAKELPDPESYAHFLAPFEGHPVSSYLAVPVVCSSGEVIGGLVLGHPRPGIFKAEQEQIVRGIAVQACVALENTRLYEEVRSLSRKKDDFIAVASHELKTPLTSLKGYLQILESRDVDAVAKIFIHKGINQVDRLNSLITDLFDVSKIAAGKLQLHIEPFDLQQLVQDIVEAHRYGNQSHDIIVHSTGRPLPIDGDQQRVEQVIINLINNAIKYSPEASKVFISLDYNTKEVLLKVRDEGIGMSPEEKEKIFTRFYRAKGIGKISSLGLGLYISKQIIDQHKGRMGLESEPGKGSEFYFTLPLKIY